MAGTSSRSPAGSGEREGLITLAACLGSVMQVFDTSLASVALPHMQGTLSATQDQISWVLTSYIVAVAVFTPLSGWFSVRLGRKRFFLICICGFIVTSLLVAQAGSLFEIVIFRFFQGMFGAPLIPVSQTILLNNYPRERHGQAMGWWTMGMMFGPIVGPTLGGYITEFYNWRLVFYMNLPIGLLAFVAILFAVPEGEKEAGRPFDVFGFTMLSIALISLQLMLDRGERADWFQSTEIVVAAGVSAACFYVFLIHILTTRQPFITPQIFKNRNFVAGLAMMFLLGILMMVLFALLPPFMYDVLDYPVDVIGLVMAPRGTCTMLASILAGRLLLRYEPRPLILIGTLLIGYSVWQMSLFTPDIAPIDIVVVTSIQGFGQGLFFVPMSTATFATLTQNLRGEGTAMFSLIRNVGGSIGVAILVSQLVSRKQSGHAALAENIGPYSEVLRHTPLPHAWNFAEAGGAMSLNAELTRQAAMLAYIHDFQLVAVAMMLAVPLVLLMKKPQPAR